MRRFIFVNMSIALIAAASVTWPARLTAQQAQPRQQGDGERSAEPRSAPPQQPRARPRPPAEPRPPAQRPRGEPRAHRPPPPRVLPPAYYAAPHRYYFPPVSLHRGYYYHPYFGFYFGPYYGPFYPYPGPFAGQLRPSVSAVRTRVKPVETEVYVNGYFAGLVDDFDGVFQRLYLPPGEQDLEFRLEGYQTWRQRLYLQPADSRDVVHTMRRLSAGEVADPLAGPAPVPGDWTTPTGTPGGGQPASPFGILTLRVEPADAQVLIDGEVWLGLEGRRELVIHVPAGSHQLEVRREGYQPFTTGISLSEGAATRLDVRLTP